MTLPFPPLELSLTSDGDIQIRAPGTALIILDQGAARQLARVLLGLLPDEEYEAVKGRADGAEGP